MMTPQLTEQYGHVLRVSVVREIFRLSACSSSGCASKPKTVIPTAPTTPVLKNARLETSITQPSMQRDFDSRKCVGMERKRFGSARLQQRKEVYAVWSSLTSRSYDRRTHTQTPTTGNSV